MFLRYLINFASIKLNIAATKVCFVDACISFECNNYSQCLYDKCVNGYCIFNENAPVVHCNNIYLGLRKSYMYCGKAFNDKCNFENECS